jgi:hypothetical protein
MFRLIPFLILVLDIVVILDIIKSNKDGEKKLLWIVAVIFLPVLGPILWFLLGKNK